MLGLIQGSRIDNDTYITDVALAEDDTGLDITIVIGTEPRDGVPIEEIKRELFTRLTARPGHRGPAHARPAAGPPDPGPPGRRSPGSGGPGSSPAPLAHPARPRGSGARMRDPGQRPGHGGRRRRRRHLLHRRHPGFRAAGRRAGTTGTPTTTRRRRSTRSSTRPTRSRSPSATAARSGPRPPSPPPSPGPTGSTESTKSRVGSHQVAVETTLELRADESVVRVRTRFDNPSRDHRLRAHLPLPRAGDHLAGRVRLHRRRARPGGRGPARGVRHAHLPLPPVRLGRRAHRGPRGPARVRAGRSSTRRRRLRRPGPRRWPSPCCGATGMLSRLGMTTRPLTGRPDDAAGGSQLIGPVERRYAIAVGDVDPYRLADDVLVPLAATGVVRRGRPARPGLGTDRARRRGVRRPPRGRSARGPGVQPAADADHGRDPRRSGWLVDLRGDRSPPSRGTSTSGPTASPPSGSTG